MDMNNEHVMRLYVCVYWKGAFYPVSKTQAIFSFRFAESLVHKVMLRSDFNASKYHSLYIFQYSYAVYRLFVISSLIVD